MPSALTSCSPLPRVDALRPRRRRRPGRLLSAHRRILRAVAASAATASPPASAPASAGATRSGWRLLTLLACQRGHGWRHVRRDVVEAGQRSPEECAGGAVRRPSEMNAELVRRHLLAHVFGISSLAQSRARAAMRRIHQRASCKRAQLLHHPTAAAALTSVSRALATPRPSPNSKKRSELEF